MSAGGGVYQELSMSQVVQPAPCAISPKDKKAQAKRVGDDLVRHHGKRKFYTVDQVRDANRRNGIGSMSRVGRMRCSIPTRTSIGFIPRSGTRATTRQ